MKWIALRPHSLLLREFLGTTKMNTGHTVIDDRVLTMTTLLLSALPYRRGVVWAAQQPTLRLQRVPAVARRGPRVEQWPHPAQRDGSTQHGVCLRPDDIRRYSMGVTSALISDTAGRLFVSQTSEGEMEQSPGRKLQECFKSLQECFKSC